MTETGYPKGGTALLFVDPRGGSGKLNTRDKWIFRATAA
jgi:hypothetical protein